VARRQIGPNPSFGFERKRLAKHHLISPSEMRHTGRMKPRDPARFIAIKENTQCLYFEITPTGSLIPPPEFVRGKGDMAELPDDIGVSEYFNSPSTRGHPAVQFVGFLDLEKLTPPTRGFSISDILAIPVPLGRPRGQSHPIDA
jgi:hypothetical protein